MENLRKSLEQLHKELQNAKHLDDDSKKLLKDLLNDIKVILDNNNDTNLHEHQNLLDKLKESSQKFELTHPELAGAINIVINSLSNLGI